MSEYMRCICGDEVAVYHQLCLSLLTEDERLFLSERGKL